MNRRDRRLLPGQRVGIRYADGSGVSTGIVQLQSHAGTLIRDDRSRRLLLAPQEATIERPELPAERVVFEITVGGQ